MKKILIIGGGVSGITTSIFAKKKNNEVIVLERNAQPLKKILMTGNGKCNYMNEENNMDSYHSQNMDIVEDIITWQNIERVKDFFSNLGIVPKVKNGYYYPFSNQASTVRDALMGEATRKGVVFKYNCLVNSISKKNNKFIVVTDTEKYEADVVVLACGSKAYPKTGSDGMGYLFLKVFKHTIIEPLPALVQLESKGSFLKEWDGVRSDVSLDLFEDGKYITSEKGEIQLTNYGISGICTFQLSHFVTRGLFEGKKEVIKINFVPFIDDFLAIWFDKFAKDHSNKNIKELLEGILNYKLVSIILKESKINKDSFYLDLSNEEKIRLIHQLRSFEVPITGTKGFDSCQICNGGVSLEEIDSHTMESKLVKGLFIVGELLDINGNCGGYNLTTCWISSMLAGKKIGGYHD